MTMYDEYKKKKKDWIIYTVLGTFNKAIGTELEGIVYNKTEEEVRKAVDPINEENITKKITSRAGMVHFIDVEEAEKLITERELSKYKIIDFLERENYENKKTVKQDEPEIEK